MTRILRTAFSVVALAGTTLAATAQDRPWVDPPTTPQPAAPASPAAEPAKAPAPQTAAAPAKAPAPARQEASEKRAAPKPRVAAKPSPIKKRVEASRQRRQVAQTPRRAPRTAAVREAPEQDLELMTLRTIELPDGRQVQFLVRPDGD